MPTGKVSLSSRSLTFKSNQLQFDIKTTFNDAKQLLNSAYNLFLFDLKSLEEQHTHINTQSNDNLDKNKVNNQQTNGDTLADDNDDGQKADSAKIKLDENANQSCDINKFIINAEIQTMGDVFLHMNVDESYELNVTSMIEFENNWNIFFLAKSQKKKTVLSHSFTDANGNTIHVQLKAKSFFGARHGLSTLQQLIWFDDEDNLLRIMSAAHVIDEPKFKWIIFLWYHKPDWILGNYMTHFLFDPIKLVQKTEIFFSSSYYKHAWQVVHEKNKFFGCNAKGTNAKW